MRGVVPFIAAALSLLGGCIPMPEKNALLGTTRAESSIALQHMLHDHKPLVRPVVVLNGYHGPPSIANRIARKLSFATTGRRSDFLAISYTFGSNLDVMARDIAREIESRWPSTDPEQTVEVDVVGISMGGLVARWAAIPPADRVRGDHAATTSPGKRLRIARLFTLGTPHRGAVIADSITPDAAARDMRAGSPFLTALDRHGSQGFPMVCYAQMRDKLCGATRCAPPGQVPIWTSGAFLFSHVDLPDNPVFLADIARHLRGESPVLKPAEPPPGD